VRDFISEDDLDSFEGWLEYQRVDTATTSADQLSMWRDLYDEAKAASASTPKVGSMKLKPGGHRYAVAVRDGTNLWLTLWVRRSRKGDVYVLVPRGDRLWNPHFSYHRDGKVHSKSYGEKFLSQQRQPLTGSFRGTEHLGVYGGHAPKGVGAICDSNDFSGIIVLAPGILGPMHGNVAVDLIEPDHEPLDLMMSGHKKVERRVFGDAVPYVVIRVLAHIAQ